MQHVRIRYVVVILAMAALLGFRLLPAMAHSPKGDGPQIDTWQTFGFCRKVRFLGQNPKIECREFNDLQTAKLSKKQLCDRTDERANWLRSLAVAGAGRAILDSRMVKKLMRPRAHSISGAPQAV